MIFKTYNCYKLEHPEFCITCDPNIIPDIDADWILNFLEGEVKRGVKFTTNETIQIGGTINQFKMMEDRHLHVLEPDFKSVPIIFIDSTTSTLKYLRQQKDIAHSIRKNIEVSYVSILKSIAVGKTYKNATSFFLSREETEDSFSGYFFRNLQTDNDEYTLVSLYEFACNRPDLVKFLGLPSQYGVHKILGDDFRIINEERDVPLRPGSFLDLINRS